jgi:hypothetical protein
MSDEIASIESYRGVGIDDCQPAERIATVVRPAIDEVVAMSRADELLAYARDIARPPEARRLAAAKCEALFEMAAADRVERPNLRIDRVRAAVAGLSSRRWRSPWAYCSLLDLPKAPGQPGPAPRPPEFAQQVEDDRELAEP